MRRILSLGLFLLFSGIALGDRVFIESPKETLPHDLDPKSLRELIRSSVAGMGHEVVESAVDADFNLRPNVLKLGASYILTIDKVSHGKIVNSAKLKAKELDELDEVASRVVRAALTEVEAKKDARPSDVTEEEVVQGNRRRIGRSGTIVGGGIGLLGGLSNSSPAYYFTLGHGWAMGPVVFGVRTDFCINPDARNGTAFLSDFLINLTYYWFDRDISPFASGEYGFGLGRDSSTGTVSGGMYFGATLGMAFFRTYTMHIEVGLRFGVLASSAFPAAPKIGALAVGLSF